MSLLCIRHWTTDKYLISCSRYALLGVKECVRDCISTKDKTKLVRFGSLAM